MIRNHETTINFDDDDDEEQEQDVFATHTITQCVY